VSVSIRLIRTHLQHRQKKEGNTLIRIDENSRSGKFLNGWVCIDTMLVYINNKELFGWSVLLPMFQHHSVNTAGFVGAVLVKEGIAEVVEEGRRRSYRHTGKKIKTTKQRGKAA